MNWTGILIRQKTTATAVQFLEVSRYRKSVAHLQPGSPLVSGGEILSTTDLDLDTSPYSDSLGTSSPLSGAYFRGVSYNHPHRLERQEVTRYEGCWRSSYCTPLTLMQRIVQLPVLLSPRYYHDVQPDAAFKPGFDD
jgi:hypothetical protein